MKKIVLSVFLLVISIIGISRLAKAAQPSDFNLKEGDVISAEGDPDVYIINDFGYKRLFVNPEIFNLYGHLGWNKIKKVSPATRDAFITSGLFRNCEVTGTAGERVYGLDVIKEDVANLRWVNTSGAQAVIDDPNFFQKVFCINTGEVKLYGSGAQYTSVTQIRNYTRVEITINNYYNYPTPTPSTSASPTPTPTATVTVTPTPTPTSSTTPTPSPTASPTPSPTSTPVPTQTPTPTPLPTNATLTLSAPSSLDTIVTGDQKVRDILYGSFDTLAILSLTAKDSRIIIKSVSVTFLNDDPTARLINVGINGVNEIPAVEPGMSYTFSRNDPIGSYQDGQLVYPYSVTRFSAWGHTKDGNAYSGPNVIGWQIRINSLTAIIADNPTVSATVVGLPMTLNSIPRDASISLVSDSPSGLQSQNLSIATILKLKARTTYPDIKITSLKVKVVGKSVSNNQTESIIENFSVTNGNLGSITSGSSVSRSVSIRIGAGGSGYGSGEINFTVDVTNETSPGTSWQLTLEETTAVDNSGRPITISGLPVSGYEIHW